MFPTLTRATPLALAALALLALPAGRAADEEADRRLADHAAAPAQPVSTLVQLGDALGEAGAPAGAVDVLRRAQRRHPGDFWVNHELASWLLRAPPPRWDEAVRFFSAALALRPESPAV